MKPQTIILSAIACAMLCCACDDGRIYGNGVTPPQEGRVARVSGHFSGIDTWPSGYHVSVSGFKEGSDYAVISKNISVDETVLTGISDEVTELSLCVVDRLRNRVISFSSMELPVTRDTIEMKVDVTDVSMFGAIEHGIFATTCAQCHGATGYAAAGLDLTAGHGYSALVNTASTIDPTMLRVEPGNSDNSLLYKALSSDMSASWRYDHTSEVVNDSRLQLIKDWIDNGAKR